MTEREKIDLEVKELEKTNKEKWDEIKGMTNKAMKFYKRNSTILATIVVILIINFALAIFGLISQDIASIINWSCITISLSIGLISTIYSKIHNKKYNKIWNEITTIDDKVLELITKKYNVKD